jgi:holliday junction DNA helicase RuvA
MIGKIKGIVDTIELDSVIVDIAGVGYLLRCSGRALSNMNIGDNVELFVETYVREDQITLYGFMSKQEKQCFLKLVTVKGVGPRLALQILSYLTADQIFIAITTKDSVVFSNISGVGPKLVNRIFAELKEKDFAEFALHTHDTALQNTTTQVQSLKNDAISALVNLGINKTDAYVTVSTILAEQKDIDLNNVIKLSLNSLSKIGT